MQSRSQASSTGTVRCGKIVESFSNKRDSNHFQKYKSNSRDKGIDTYAKSRINTGRTNKRGQFI